MNPLSSFDENLPMRCGRLCSQDHLTHLVTRLGLIEGDILEQFELDKIINLRELMDIMKWEPCAIAMAVGSLIRQGMVSGTEHGHEVFLELCERSSQV